MKNNIISLAIGMVLFGILFGVFAIKFDLVDNVYTLYIRYLVLSYTLLKNIERKQVKLIEKNS